MGFYIQKHGFLLLKNWKTEPRGGCQLPNGNLNPRVIIQEAARRTMLAATWPTDRESHATTPLFCVALVLVRFDQIELSPERKSIEKTKQTQTLHDSTRGKLSSNNFKQYLHRNRFIWPKHVQKSQGDYIISPSIKNTHTPKKGHSPAIFFPTLLAPLHCINHHHIPSGLAYALRLPTCITGIEALERTEPKITACVRLWFLVEKEMGVS